MTFKTLAIASSLLISTGIALALSLAARASGQLNGAPDCDRRAPADANLIPGAQPSPRLNTAPALERLLQQRLQHPETAEAIDAQIHNQFVETHAILVLDSSGFSRISHEQGIISALAEIERMRGAVLPVIAAHQGSVFKIEVDNVYAVFPTVELAIAASNAMIQQVAPLQKHISIGIGYGELIMISRDNHYSDVYGEQMNLASKLGEDLAGRDEVMLSEAAFQQIDPVAANGEANWDLLQTEISGLQISVYKQRPTPHLLEGSAPPHLRPATPFLAPQTGG